MVIYNFSWAWNDQKNSDWHCWSKAGVSSKISDAGVLDIMLHTKFATYLEFSSWLNLLRQVCICMSDCSDSAALPSTASNSFLLSVLSCVNCICIYTLAHICTLALHIRARHGVCSVRYIFVKATCIAGYQYWFWSADKCACIILGRCVVHALHVTHRYFVCQLQL